MSARAAQLWIAPCCWPVMILTCFRSFQPGGDTTYKAAMVSSAFSACRNEVSEGAATREYCVGNSGITAIDDDRRADNRMGAVIVCI